MDIKESLPTAREKERREIGKDALNGLESKNLSGRSPERKPLSAEAVRRGLEDRGIDAQLFVYGELDSTNDQAKRLLTAGMKGPALLLAEWQTEGRGRQGRSFWSPPGGLYMSLVLSGAEESGGDLAAFLPATTMAAVAVVGAIEALTDQQPKIKWVNDVYLNGRKICGILAEATTGDAPALVTGIGVNLEGATFPGELADSAGALPSEDLTREALAAEITARFLSMTAQWEERSYLEDYRRCSLALGREIEYWTGGRSYRAMALDIDRDGGLLIRRPDGSEDVLRSGEISLRIGKEDQPRK